MNTVTHPYGSIRKCVLIDMTPEFQIARDTGGEGHVLLGGARDLTAKAGDSGTLTFMQGGPTGGFWKLTKDKG